MSTKIEIELEIKRIALDIALRRASAVATPEKITEVAKAFEDYLTKRDNSSSYDSITPTQDIASKGTQPDNAYNLKERTFTIKVPKDYPSDSGDLESFLMYRNYERTKDNLKEPPAYHEQGILEDIILNFNRSFIDRAKIEYGGGDAIEIIIGNTVMKINLPSFLSVKSTVK